MSKHVAAPRRFLEKGRIEAFSDGVIAVAITLLVLDLRVPEPVRGEPLWFGLLALWPNLLAYVISLIAIGIIWINHHTMLRRLVGIDHEIVVLNLILLMCIVLLPFSTSLLATYLDEPNGRHLAAVVYAGSFFVTSLVFICMQRHLMHRPELFAEPLSPSDVRAIIRRAAIAPPAYVVAGLAGLITPYLTLAVCIVMGIFYLTVPPSQQGTSASE